MLTEKRTPRQWTTSFALEVSKKCEIFAARARERAERQATSSIQTTQRAIAHAPERNLKNPMTPSFVELLPPTSLNEGCKDGRMDQKMEPTHPSSLNDSYKAEKPDSENLFQLAESQNPTNDPEIDMLFSRFGDLRGVIMKHPIFRTPCLDEADGGWGLQVGTLINAGKQYTLARVLWALREAKEYRGAKNRGAMFIFILRNGLERDR